MPNKRTRARDVNVNIQTPQIKLLEQANINITNRLNFVCHLLEYLLVKLLSHYFWSVLGFTFVEKNNLQSIGFWNSF